MHTLNRRSILSAALIISLFSCSKNETNPDKDSPVIEIKVPDITLPEISDGSTTANFTASAPWTLEVSNTRSSPDWLTVSPTSGKAGDVTLTVTTTEANEDYDDRNAYMKIKAGSVTKIITVTQKKKEALLLSKDRYEISPEGGRFSVEVKSNVSYQVTIDEMVRIGCPKSSKAEPFRHRMYISASLPDHLTETGREPLFSIVKT